MDPSEKVCIVKKPWAADKGKENHKRTAILRWSVRDITTASVVGVFSSFLFWGAQFIPFDALQVVLPGLGGLLNGLWLFAGPLAAVIVKKPGGALYSELLASVLESFLGSTWGGMEIVVLGILQGAAAEVGFACFGYRRWSFGTTCLSGFFSGIMCFMYTFLTHLQAINPGGPYGIVYGITTILSGIFFGGVCVWLLYKRLVRAGVVTI